MGGISDFVPCCGLSSWCH